MGFACTAFLLPIHTLNYLAYVDISQSFKERRMDMKHIFLEPEAEALSRKSAMPPLIFQLPPEQGRKVLEQAQNTPVYKYPANITVLHVDTGAWGTIQVFLVCPENLTQVANVIFYLHGAGWVFGSFHTHEKLVRELAFRSQSVVIFPEYTRSPEVQYPVANEQSYQVMLRIPKLLESLPVPTRLDTFTVAGDSVGGNMAIAMALMAQQRKGPYIHKMLLYYPVTNACFDTPSYQEFACGYYLYRAGMQWFWEQYAPCMNDRNEITASPLRATEAQLRYLPPTMICNGEADVLRDEGEAFANKLRHAGVEVTQLRFGGMIHDFVMLNALDQTQACRAAMDASVGWLRRRNLK